MEECADLTEAALDPLLPALVPNLVAVDTGAVAASRFRPRCGQIGAPTLGEPAGIDRARFRGVRTPAADKLDDEGLYRRGPGLDPNAIVKEELKRGAHEDNVPEPDDMKLDGE